MEQSNTSTLITLTEPPNIISRRGSWTTDNEEKQNKENKEKQQKTYTPRERPWTLETASNFLYISEHASSNEITKRRDELLSVYPADECNGPWDKEIGIPSPEYNCEKIAQEIISATEWMLERRRKNKEKREEHTRKLKIMHERERQESLERAAQRRKESFERNTERNQDTNRNIRESKNRENEKKERENKEREEKEESERKSQQQKIQRLYKTSAGALLTTGVLGYGAYKISTYMKKAEKVVDLADTNIVDILATVIHLKNLIPPENKDLLYQTNDAIRQLQDIIKATTVAKKANKSKKKNINLAGSIYQK